MPFIRSVRLEWTGEGQQFTGTGTEPPSPSIPIDGDSQAAPGPMQVLLLAAAACSGGDVVSILGKMRVTLRRLEIAVEGTRRDEQPRRYVAIRFRFTLGGHGLDRNKAERAVTLSMEKYCSVIASLAPDIAVTHDVILA